MAAINRPDLSIIIPALKEADNLAHLIPQIRSVLAPLSLTLEIIVVDETADEETNRIVAQNNAILLSPPGKGYGFALRSGFNYAHADYIVTMDADLSHPPAFLRNAWNSRKSADILIASRYVPGGKAKMSFPRLVLSKTLNVAFSRGLDLQIQDMSSGFRMYRKRSILLNELSGNDFNILQELLIHALKEGYQIREIPFTYSPRASGSSHARILKFGLAYTRTFLRLWRIRNSVASADYDARAYNSWLLPQRYWQRKRYQYITKLANGAGKCLDIGCGSSRILQSTPHESVGLDILFHKLRYARRFKENLINGSALNLPIKNASLTCVICSQVIEHIRKAGILEELDRVIKPEGLLILGTPDYSKWQWILIEWIYGKVLPQAYADEHITRYTYRELINEFVKKRRYTLEASHYILQGELILSLRKPRLQNSL